MTQREWEELITSLTVEPVTLRDVYDGAEFYVGMGCGSYPLRVELFVNEKAKIRQVLQVMERRGELRRTDRGEYLTSTRCSSRRCTGVVKDGRKSCEVHLEQGRRQWQAYQAQCVAAGLCITKNCENRPRRKTGAAGPRAGAPRELRCESCARKNAQNMKEWQGRRK